MGACTDFFAARRSDLCKGGESAQKAFWEHNLGFLNKAFWFDQMLWDMPEELSSPDADYKLVCSGMHSDSERPLTVGAIEYVIKKLEELDSRVLAMPCDPDKDRACWDFVRGDLAISGTPNGMAMMKEVAKVLNTRCDIDFEYPWDKGNPNYEPGTTFIRRTLKEIIDKFNVLNKDGDWMLYKTTG